MQTTDTTEKALETLIVNSLINDAGYDAGSNDDYDRERAIDLKKLINFLQATQPDIVAALNLTNENPKRDKFLNRLQGEIEKRGVIDVLRNGIKYNQYSVELFYGTPTLGNTRAEKLFAQNIFSVTRQLAYSRNQTKLALDMVIFINGLPVATFELKNNLTKQTVEDGVQQYKNDRDPKELLFRFGRCMVHFAVDEHEVKMCTHLQKGDSWFLPFNKGYNDGAGNPPNPEGIATDYLWKQILRKQDLTDIIENYAQIVEEKDKKTKKKTYKQIFPRYHQLDVVKKLLADVARQGVGKRYLIQHSAGSGKSNSIAWLAHQLIGLKKEGNTMFESIIVVTDRRILDKQIRDTIKQFAQVSATVGHAKKSGDLRKFIKDGKKIIISTVQKFPYILDDIGDQHRDRNFAIIIDEAHSSQGGRTSAKMNVALSEKKLNKQLETMEDKINQIIESRKMLGNAAYFAFTATPKNKTLEIFGEPYPAGDEIKHKPFHSYTMKQAIQENFIVDVIKHYTTVSSYYRLAKTIENDPEYDSKKARKKLRRYVEHHDHAIRQKAEIMIDHFHEKMLGRHKIGGKARAMVITNGVELAIQYYHAIKEYLIKRKSPYKAIVAFSGEREYDGKKVTEASLNQFPSSMIRENIRKDPYRFLVVADKFQTGYDEPLLHTMYVDKPLAGIRAVQTLSRLNRAHPKKHDTFVLDFYNDSDIIEYAFQDYYQTTILSEETDPNKLHDLKGDLDGYQVYSWMQVEEVVRQYLNGESREKFEPILAACVSEYIANLDEDAQVDFKGKAKAFVRTYNFLASILDYPMPAWEKLSIFLNFLILKLPAPVEEDHSRGILEAIDMDSYRVEVKSAIQINLDDEDAEIEPIPTSGGGRKPEPELDLLSNIIKTFNETYGTEFNDVDKVRKDIFEYIKPKIAEDEAYQNAVKNSDKQNARIELEKALKRIVMAMFKDNTELFKQFMDNPSFKKWLSDTLFNLTYGDLSGL